MPETQAGLPSGKKMRKTLSRRILRSTILNILTVVVICCVIPQRSEGWCYGSDLGMAPFTLFPDSSVHQW